MTRLDKIKRYLLSESSIMLMKPIEPLRLNKILVQAALMLGIKLKEK